MILKPNYNLKEWELMQVVNEVIPMVPVERIKLKLQELQAF